MNVNGIGCSKSSCKSDDIRHFMDKKEVDVMGLAETNVNWAKVRNKDTLWERTRSWFEHRVLSVAYNTTDRIGKKRHQQGGTATLLKNKIAHRHKDSGFDRTGLGRWSWVRIAGKQGFVTRFVTLYCPVKTGKGNTIYTQHLRELNEDPTERFWQDITMEVLKWHADGEQLLLSGDWNEPMDSPNMTAWMELLGLKDAIGPSHEGKSPPTYHRGQDTIDGILLSKSLNTSSSGFLGFGAIPGDHRCLWIDISNQHVMGYKMNDIPKHKARRLKLDDPRVVDKYLRILDACFKTDELNKRLTDLRAICESASRTPQWIAAEYNKLDTLRESGMTYAEKKCRKLRMGGVVWSPVIQTARDTILFWTLLTRKRRNCYVGMRRILRLKKKLKITGETALSITAVHHQVDLAYTRYKKLKKRAYDERLNYQEALAQAKADASDSDALKILRAIQHREHKKRVYQQLGSSLKSQSGSTTKIHIRTPRGIKEITQMATMENYIMTENERKFHQTEGWSPLLQGQLAQDIGLLGDGPKVEEILKGQYKIPPGTPPVVQRWLDTLKCDPSQHKWSQATLQDYKTGWNKVKERTSSGALHFGHFKAGVNTYTIGRVHYLMSMIPMQYGFSPQRWLQGTDVMILKQPDNFLLDKLRTIVLYEADFNHENKRIGKQAMSLALAKGRIAVEQFSRPGRSAQDNALGKRLVFDHFRFAKSPFGICSCDLKSCYDRVVHSAASMALQRIGVPLESIKCMFGTIQNLIHCVRTAYGKSDKTFGGPSCLYQCPPQGLGQGNGAGPTVWSILCSTVFEALHVQGYSTQFCSALSLGLLRMCGFAYVDDSDLIADGSTVGEAYSKLQQILTEWDHIMQVNGAALALDKCWWYLIDFTWKHGKWKYSSPLQSTVLQARDKQSTLLPLQRLNHSDSKEMVGVMLAPDGNHKEQVSRLSDKTKDWASKIDRSSLDEEAVWTALKETIPMTVQYPLAANTLTQSDLNQIMVPVFQTALPRANIVRTFPRAVLFGPTEYQGLGLTDPYIFQYCRHVQDMVDQPWRGTEVGKLMISNLEAAKLEAGIYGSLFDSSTQVSWFNTTQSLVLETLRFCRQHKICFDEPGQCLQPNCDKDSSLMASLAQMDFTKGQLKAINRCRLYHRVISVSDITDGFGIHLLFPSMQKPIQWPFLYNYKWPSQGKPSQQEWDLYLQAIKSCFAGSGRSLRYTLGRWHKSFQCQHPRWEYYIYGADLYQRHGTRWRVRKMISSSRGRNALFSLEGTITSVLPQEASPTRVVVTPTHLQSTGTRSKFALSSLHSVAPTLHDILKTFPDTEWTCKWLEDSHNLPALAAQIYQGNGLGVSDGSYHPGWDLCSAGWILWTLSNEFRGGGTIPGPALSNSSYRGELGGLLSIVIMLRILETLFPPVQPYRFKLACDGLSPLTKSMLTDREYFGSSYKDFDLISRIIAHKEALTAIIVPIHVKGHQIVSDRQRTLASLLNERMDTLAKLINEYTQIQDLDVPDALPQDSLGLIQVDHHLTPIVSNLSRSLAVRISRDRLLSFWTHKGRMPPPYATDWIDWKVVQTTMKESSRRMRLFISKWVTNQAAVGEVMLRRGYRDSGLCPCCNIAFESRLHLLQCPSVESRKVWDRGRKKVRKWLKVNDTDPGITSSICKLLRRIPKLSKLHTYTPSSSDPQIQRCLNAQTHLGWIQFMEGIFTTDWAATQHSYFQSIQSRRTGHRWAVGLSTQLWRLTFSMWDHRNQVLHNTTASDHLQGLDVVKTAIVQELSLGLDTLDTIYTSYFSISSTSVQTMKSVDARNWLTLIRRAREASGYIYNDHISASKALQKWIGLKKPTLSANSRFSRTGYHA